MRFKIFNSKEKKAFEEKAGKKIDGMLLESRGEIRIYTGNLSRDELERIFKNVNVLRIGLKVSSL